VAATLKDVGEMDELIEAAVTGEDIDINFNSTYVGDSLQSIHADSLTFSFAGNGKPLVIRPIGDLSFMYLVMPLNR
jgi:DNA polymerase-3 subunit beta